MAESTSNSDSQQQAQQDGDAPVFQIQRVYLKDASLELPNAPKIFLEQDAPNIEVQVDTETQALTSEIYEACVIATVTARVKDKTLFLVEAKQAGIFQIAHLPSDQLNQVLGIMCPNIVYPYLRANISDLVSRTGLPPVTLTEINWEAFYQQRMANALQTSSSPARIQ